MILFLEKIVLVQLLASVITYYKHSKGHLRIFSEHKISRSTQKDLTMPTLPPIPQGRALDNVFYK